MSPPPALRPRTRLVIVLLLVAPLALAVPAVVGRRGAEEPLVRGSADDVPSSSPSHALSPDASADANTLAAPTPRPASDLPRPVLGFALSVHHIDDLDAYLASVDSIAALGANMLIVLSPMYVHTSDSNAIHHVSSQCPTRKELVAILARAKASGLSTALMPIVLIEKPREGEWRGALAPEDWNHWWASYDGFIDWFLDVAIETDVDLFSIGSELNSTETQYERWRRVAARARSRFDGLLTYSSNWDRFDQVSLWQLVDVMSVSAYFELERTKPDAPEAALVEAWRPEQEKLAQTARRWERPLLMIEVGYPSLPWASTHPWNYVAEDEQADHEAQARSWRAFFAAWKEPLIDLESPVIGFCGYRWDPYHSGGADDIGYGIAGKPAHDVVRAGFASIRAAVETDESAADSAADGAKSGRAGAGE